MRILQVLTNFDWEFGGPVRVVFDISRMLSKRGHNVTVFTTDEGMRGRLPLDNRIRPDGNWNVRYFKCENNYLANRLGLHFSREMQDAIEIDLGDFDIVHTHEWRSIPNIYIWKSCSRLKIPYVIQAHGTSQPAVAANDIGHIFSQILFDRIVGRTIAKHASRTIAYNQTEATQYLEQGIDSDKIDLLPNGIEVSDFEDLPKRGAFREKVGIAEEERIVLYLGRLNRIKGLDILLNAFAKSASGRNSRLVVVGPDDGARQSLETQSRRLGIMERVTFCGALIGRDKLEAFVDADVYVLPSRYEAFSLTVFEALACQTPVIISDRCGVKDIIRDGNAGLVVQPTDTNIAAAIDKLLGDENLRTQLGHNGQRLVKENYSWDKVVCRLEKIYSRAIREHEDAKE